ncbi:MAG TPA: cytochrome P450 [Vicinamibacterales bacterium]|jgi:hypothetical protein
MTSTAGAPTFNPFLPAFRDNPYLQYHAVRERDPVHWAFFGVWLLTRYSDVVAALRDQRLSADPRNWEGYKARYLRGGDEPGPLARFHSKWLLGIDPPDHTRLRRLAAKAFTPKAIEQMRPDIEQHVARLLDRIEGAETVDAIADLAYPLPLLVIAEMLGVPTGDIERLKKWSFELNASFDPLMPMEVFRRANEVVSELTEYFRRLIAVRRSVPGLDLLSALIDASDEEDRLSEEELLATCILLFWAGHETTVNLLGNGVLTLLRHPAELGRLRRDPELVPSAVEEMLRFESPVQLTYRSALDDLEVQGRVIRKGQQVVLALGAANRDPAHFPDPDRFDIARPDNHHVAFSHGIHFCLGAALARLQAQTLFRELTQRFPRLALTAPALTWNPNILVRGLTALPVTVGPRHRFGSQTN